MHRIIIEAYKANREGDCCDRGPRELSCLSRLEDRTSSSPSASGTGWYKDIVSVVLRFDLLDEAQLMESSTTLSLISPTGTTALLGCNSRDEARPNGACFDASIWSKELPLINMKRMISGPAPPLPTPKKKRQ